MDYIDDRTGRQKEKDNNPCNGSDVVRRTGRRFRVVYAGEKNNEESVEKSVEKRMIKRKRIINKKRQNDTEGGERNPSVTRTKLLLPPRGFRVRTTGIAFTVRDRFAGDSELYAGPSRINVAIFPPSLPFFPFSGDRRGSDEEKGRRCE